MKKLSAVLALTLVLAFTLAGCSSDDKKSDSKSSDGKKSSSNSKGNSSSGSIKTDSAAEDKFDSDVASMKSVVASSCDDVKGMYSRYKSAGDSTDGFDEILDIQYVFSTLGDTITDGTNFYDWPTYGKYETYYADNVTPFVDKMWDLSASLGDVTNSAIDNAQTAEQTQRIHTTIAEFEDYVNDSEFGPCAID